MRFAPASAVDALVVRAMAAGLRLVLMAVFVGCWVLLLGSVSADIETPPASETDSAISAGAKGQSLALSFRPLVPALAAHDHPAGPAAVPSRTHGEAVSVSHLFVSLTTAPRSPPR